MNYKPYALPVLPRASCPYEGSKLGAGRDLGAIQLKECGKPTFANGWCRDHTYVQELLELAVLIGCPEYVIATVKDRGREYAVITTGASLMYWEAYAVRHPLKRHRALMARMQQTYNLMTSQDAKVSA